MGVSRGSELSPCLRVPSEGAGGWKAATREPMAPREHAQERALAAAQRIQERKSPPMACLSHTPFTALPPVLSPSCAAV